MSKPGDSTTMPRVHRQVVDHGVLAFDRESGVNVLLQNERTWGFVRRAPRVLQVSLLSQCNLQCEYCYCARGPSARLDPEFLFDLLRRAADWGVLEVAFGGGEPLMYPGLLELVERLHTQTSLGVNITTNGMLLSRDVMDGLAPHVGEIRISAHCDSHCRSTLRRLAGHNVAVNWLVSPSTVGLVEPYVRDFLRLGAKNVLLLGYKGEDESLHLRSEHIAMLKRAVLRMQHLPLRLDACWYPLLAELPHLFPRVDCSAGSDFLVITADRAVQPCSFSRTKLPFRTFSELQEIYERLRIERSPAQLPGCTRHLFTATTPATRPAATRAWIWQARASNNSGDWTIVGRFQTAEEAEHAAESLRELARAHEAFLASPEGQQWLKDNGYMGHLPSPPLQLFGQSHGFDWTGKHDGLWWEEDGCGAPVLTAGAVGASIVVYHPYCMGLPERPFKEFFERVGAREFRYWQYDRPAVVATAKGNSPAAIKMLQDFVALVAAAEYAAEVQTPPPWGLQCQDPRLAEDEDRSSRLATGEADIEQLGDRLRVVMTFENTFAGSVALANWLVAAGYQDVTVEVDDVLEEIEPAHEKRSVPKLGLFGDVRPLKDRLAGAPPEKIIELAFTYESERPAGLTTALNSLAPELRLRLGQACWERARAANRDVTRQALMIIQELGLIAADWARVAWQDLIDKRRHYAGLAIQSLAASLPSEEAFALAKAWVEQAADREDERKRLMALRSIANRGTLELIERWWESADPGAPVTAEWATLAANSQLNWAVAERWLQRGRPLSLIALDAMIAYIPGARHSSTPIPGDFGLPSIEVFAAALATYLKHDSAPRASRAAEILARHASVFVS